MTSTTSPLSTRIADGIVELIVSEGLAPGDALESSRALAGRFEVTTPTIREALRRLEAIDVIEFRHGSGTYVGEGMRRRLLANPHPGAPDRTSACELVRARLVIEPSIAAEAARHRDAAALALLEEATHHALRPQRGMERPELSFHEALASASGNPLLRETIAALLAVRARDQVTIRHEYVDRERDHREHLAILDAVRSGDADAAAELTRSHLQAIEGALTQKDGEHA